MGADNFHSAKTDWKHFRVKMNMHSNERKQNNIVQKHLDTTGEKRGLYIFLKKQRYPEQRPKRNLKKNI